MASIIRRGDKFRVIWAVYVEGRRHLRSQSFPTMAAARTFCAARADEEARRIGATARSLGSFLEEWLTAKQTAVKATTFAGYERNAAFARGHKIGDQVLDRVTAQHLERFYRDLATTPAGRGKPLSGRSIGHIHALLQNALGDAQRWRLVAENAASLARPPRLDRAPVPVLSEAMVQAFLDDLDRNNRPLLPLAALVATSGLRRGEALGVTLSATDWVRRRIAIRQVVEEVGGAWRLRAGAKSASSCRTIAILPWVMELLAEQRKTAAEQKLRLGAGWRDHDLLFPDPLNGGPMRPAAVTRAFHRAARRAGWPVGIASVHGLRHFAASAALAGGGSLAAVSSRLGHSSPRVTLALYVHAETAQDEAAATAMGGGLRAPRSPR